MKTYVIQRQRGMAVVVLLVVLILGSAWWLVSALSTPANRTALKRDHNAKVLQQAKAALIGYVAQQAAKSDENDPGGLPCPEAPGNIGGANEGVAAGNCTLPAVGRLPWRTLGLEKLHDASAEPLWYVVSPGWAKPSSTANTVINSNSTGQLTLDTATDVVALIIAPGPSLSVQASANCTARNQVRSAPSSSIDFRDYLECQNATFPADSTFAGSGPNGSFNDQVLAVTAAEVLPGIEAAVAARFARDLAPSIRAAAYCGGLWQPCTGAGSAVYLPFAVPFSDPATSNFQGSAGTAQGLLPLSYGATQGCLPNTPSAPFCAPPPACNPATDNRCRPSFVAWRNNPVVTRTGGANLASYSCSISGTPSALTCTLNTYASVFGPYWMTFTLDATADSVGMALRQINAAVQVTGVDTSASGVNLPFGYSVSSATMNADGSATLSVSSRTPDSSLGLIGDALCGLTGALALSNNCYQHTITLPFMFVDQPILYTSNTTFAWFYRNRWHESMYYAVAAGNAPSGTGTCTAGTNCLSVNGLTPSNTQRSLVVIPGPRLAALAQSRPPISVSDWLEGSNADGNSTFALRDAAAMINRTFNDHIAVIDSN
jgi:hypothetical protein